MPIAKLIRTVLGLGGSDTDDSTESTSVTVEREPDEPDEPGAAGIDATETDVEPEPEPEAGLEETTEEPAEDAGLEPDETEETEEAAAAGAGTDAAASTDSMTQEPPEGADAAEPAEAVDVTDHSGTDTAADEPGEATGPVPEEADDGAQPVDNVSGIGPAYAQRLEDAGVETVADLLAADPEELSESTEISAKRIGRWQDRAEDL